MLFLGANLLAYCMATQATTVFQWTDEDGVVHFSDVQPANSTQEEIQHIVFDEFEPVNVEESGYSIIEQARQLSELRQQQTQQRLAERKLDLEAQRLQNELQYSGIQADQELHKVSQALPYYSVPLYIRFNRQHSYYRPYQRPYQGHLHQQKPDHRTANLYRGATKGGNITPRPPRRTVTKSPPFVRISF